MNKIKIKVRDCLKVSDYDSILELTKKRDSGKVLQSLMSLIYDAEELVRWRTVNVVGKLAKSQPELIKRVVSRLAWTLNDEAGAISWGAPVLIAEIGSQNYSLVKEVIRIVFYYLRDNETCRPPNRNIEILNAVIWAVGRVGRVHPEILDDAKYFIITFLDDELVEVRGKALWSLLGFINHIDEKLKSLTIEHLNQLKQDDNSVEIYENDELKNYSLKEMAEKAFNYLVKQE